MMRRPQGNSIHSKINFSNNHNTLSRPSTSPIFHKYNCPIVLKSCFGCRSHFDLTSPSVGGELGGGGGGGPPGGTGSTTEVFPCPLCVKTFDSAPDLELHVNIEHRDVLSPASPPSKNACPVCGIILDSDANVSNHIHTQKSDLFDNIRFFRVKRLPDT